MNKKLMSVAAAGTLLLGGCANNEESNATNATDESSDQLTVYASTFALKSIAEEIGGDRVRVEMVIPPGADPHTYEPTSKQMTQIAEADLFLTIGHDLEPYVEAMEQSLASEDVTFVKTAEDIALLSADDTVHVHGEDEHGHEADEHAHEEDEHGHEEDGHTEEEAGHSEDDGHDHGQYDPHVWLDPMNAVSMAEAVEASFAEQAPDYKDEFADRLSAFKEEADALDAELQAAVDAGSKSELLVTHAAYGYLAERYGFDQLPITGLTPSEEPSQQALKRVIEEAKLHDLKYIAFEDTVTPKVAEVVKNEIGAEAVTIYNLESVTKEQMDQSYFDLMRENVKALEIALK
ncbi:ABC transporter substrate-binding protein [Exiguobacterium sp. SH3S2]|uniref:metal ABC transporter solute-binding protein, Zn/Mn family n=1 Tax=unclassified Exiguobacterium TaxID=2644629 RepID=UPI0010406375|nr:MULTISPECIES: zinc ABC transporter substrate-binding protein [unclassified Exiguobacterium]TCI47193.1 ABC transporter substrate-binding protein [Exiguobacterium sp. SH3S3]TCI51843.1 ABC transporter substrate-binding protein [Exiguobacterium sp. SH5S13]TCI62299.1 ABC transporter substrate-binding protein [Exiguobacterium sp. SH3S1]TCI62341.1 ABC transporter substrate-binding protein [Exiguobacterium sp. SH3S2]